MLFCCFVKRDYLTQKINEFFFVESYNVES